MPHPVDAVLRQYVTPVMKAAGFRKRGRTYRLAGDNGDVVILEFDAMRHQPGLFGVDFLAVPSSCWEWCTRNSPEAGEPGVGGGAVRCDIKPPRGAPLTMKGRSPFADRWVVDPDDEGAACGTTLASLLAERYVPLMRRLLDREQVLREACDPESEVRRTWPQDVLAVLLRVDAVDAAELEELLARMSPVTPNREGIVEWARHRVANRTAS